MEFWHASFFVFIYLSAEIVFKKALLEELATKVLIGIQFLQKLSAEVPIIPSEVIVFFRRTFRLLRTNNIFEAVFFFYSAQTHFIMLQCGTIHLHTYTLLKVEISTKKNKFV